MHRRPFVSSSSRTVALVGHRSSGKTTLGDALLHLGGATRQRGRVDDKTSLLDHASEARRRGMGVALSFGWLEWGETRVQVVDTPGSQDLAFLRRRALDAVDGAVVVVHGADGVEVGTRAALRDAKTRDLPVLVVVSRAARVGDLDSLMRDIGAAAGVPAVALNLPVRSPEGDIALVPVIGLGPVAEEAGSATLRLVVSHRERLVEAVAVTDDDMLTRYLEFLELSDDDVRRGLQSAVLGGRVVPVLFSDAVAGIGGEAVLHAIVGLMPSPIERPVRLTQADGASLLGGESGPFVAQHMASLVDDDGKDYAVLRVRSGVPPRRGWFCGRTGAPARISKAYWLRGPRRAVARTVSLGAIFASWDPLPSRPGDVLVSRQPAAALALQGQEPDTGPDALAGSISDRSWASRLVVPAPSDMAALVQQLAREVHREPVLTVSEVTRDAGVVVSSASEQHLGWVLERLADVVPVQVLSAPVPYRETPAATVRGVEGVYRQTEDGEVVAFARVVLDVFPGEPGAAPDITCVAVDDDVPERFAEAVIAGAGAGLTVGPTAGFPVAGVRAVCVGGEYNAIWSTPDHFERAAAHAMRAALSRSGTAILEPWVRVHVALEASALGGVLGVVAGYRGRVLSLDTRGHEADLHVALPHATLEAFRRRLPSLTADTFDCWVREDHLESLPDRLRHEVLPTKRRTSRHGAATRRERSGAWAGAAAGEA